MLKEYIAKAIDQKPFSRYLKKKKKKNKQKQYKYALKRKLLQSMGVNKKRYNPKLATKAWVFRRKGYAKTNLRKKVKFIKRLKLSMKRRMIRVKNKRFNARKIPLFKQKKR
jgi:hypothetical protein